MHSTHLLVLLEYCNHILMQLQENQKHITLFMQKAIVEIVFIEFTPGRS